MDQCQSGTTRQWHCGSMRRCGGMTVRGGEAERQCNGGAVRQRAVGQRDIGLTFFVRLAVICVRCDWNQMCRAK
jgi:hypothetical protein